MHIFLSIHRCYPFPKRQGPRSKIALDPAPQKTSRTARQKEEGPESRYRWTTRKHSLLCLSPPRLALGAEESVFMDPHGHTIAPRCPTAVIADKIKQNISKREQKSCSAYHKHPALMQPVCTAVSTICHAGRGLAGHPQFVKVGYTLKFARRPPQIFTAAISSSPKRTAACDLF